ncbi:signal peptide peptidase SppA [Prevotella brevis]|jgi:protease IV|uniref:signal peptide peptidase SppA n=1 Tax=unclassified Prevotella TaxID=2638335 RepID=UPI000B966C14|nr:MULTISPECIES: signal peptide peptidase SppA [unclassified Prevotella]MBS7319304.1 signal peptide peptidase SppA [Prevotella sp.]MCF2558564.1 signal peptide peptidase SppA [Xylanibacter brevis]OYP45196.1 signal peptide peptidase SppA [Prevotella sp. P4-119]OYP46796.1 signal peptide peptidase SppA [Prevotella sp. P4-98]
MKDFIKYVGATITGIVMLSVIVGILGVISLVGLAASTASTVQVKDGSVFTLVLKNNIDERGTDNPIGFLNGSDTTIDGLNDIISAIHKAKDNENIKGIYIQADGMATDSPASLHAIREALLDFKKSGKWIISYSDGYSQSEYYLCSVADQILLNPQGQIGWHGLAAEPVFYKDLLAKFGVKFELCKVGKYKSAPEQVTADGMSEANREQVTAYVTGIWKVMLKDVSASRKISTDSLNAYADRFMDLADAQELIKLRLIDKTMYADEVKNVIKKRLDIDTDTDIPQLSLGDMLNVEDKKNRGDKVAVYYAYGDIVDEDNSNPMNPQTCIVGKDMCKDLEELADDDDVKAVVLRVNSPGGSAYASEQIWHAVTKLKAKKPVVVSMGGYAASGGYYISCAANYIYSDPTTITGSIGIFGMFLNYSELMKDKLGIKFDEVKTNKHANFGTRSRFFNAEEMAILDKYIGKGYELFRKRVADGRKMSVAQVEQIAQGRVWLGNDALKIHLVDGIGSLDDAVKKAAQLAKLDEYYASEYQTPSSWYETLLASASGNSGSYLDEQMQATFGELYEPLRYIKQVENMSKIQARLPYFLTIR